MGALTATSILADLRAHGARLRVAGGRVHVDGVRPADLPTALVVAARHHRDELVDELQREADRPVVAARTAAQWRGRFERLAAEQMFVEGYERTAARRWAFYELLCEWVEQHPDVAEQPNSLAEQLARHALAEIGIFEPKGDSR